MTLNEIKRRFPNASMSFIAANLTVDEIAVKQHGNSKPPTVVVCKECLKEFSVSPPCAGLRRKYCSLKCAYKSKDRMGNVKPKDRGSSTCVNCGKEFKIHRNSGKAKFCCHHCAASYIGRINIQSNRLKQPITAIVETVCKTCGKNFSSRRSSNRIYCSNKCSASDSEMLKRRVMSFTSNPLNKTFSYSRCYKQWVEVGGKKFFARSSWEANYGRYLQFQKEQGMVLDWEHEPDTFWFKNIKRGVMSYLPDFKVTTSSGIEYHEVKGWMDAKSITKIKRMAKFYPDVKLVVIDQSRYRSIVNTCGKIIPGWHYSRNSR